MSITNKKNKFKMQSKLISALFTIALIFCMVAYIISNKSDKNKSVTSKSVINDSIKQSKTKNRQYNDTL